MADLWLHSNERVVWIPNFPRCLNDSEIDIMESFLAKLQDKVVIKGGKEKVCWLETNNGIFSIKYLYSSLELGSLVSFPTDVV